MLHSCRISKFLLALPLLLLSALLVGCAPSAQGALDVAVAPVDAVPHVAAAARAESSCDAPAVSAYIAFASDNSDIHFDVVAGDFRDYAKGSDSGIVGPITGPISLSSNVTTSQLNSDIDKTTVALLTAHGTPTGLEVLKHNSTSSTASLPFGSPMIGQCNDGSAANQAGRLRYLFFASCNVLEHGPQSCRNGTTSLPYSCPGEWSSTSTDPTMQNIYARWGSKLGNGLRMVCGSSTTVTPNSINNIGKNHINTLLADKVVLSLSQDVDTDGQSSDTVGVSVGVCLARGGQTYQESPLMQDTTYTTAANRFDNVTSPLYHLQYTQPFADPHQVPVAISGGAWQNVPALMQFAKFSAAGPRCLPVGQIDPELSYEPKQTHLGKQQQELQGFNSEEEAIGDSEKEQYYFDTAAAAVKEVSGDDVSLDLATGLYDLLSTFPVDESQWEEAVPRVTVKNVFVNIPQVVQLDKLDLPQAPTREGDWQRLPAFFNSLSNTYDRPAYNLGSGEESLMPMLYGTRIVQLNADGSPILVWDNTAPFVPAGFESVRPLDEAFLRSLWQLYYRPLGLITPGDEQNDDAVVTGYLDAGNANPGAIIGEITKAYEGEDLQPYVLDSWTLGYAPVAWGKDGAPKLRLVYRFRFVANEHEGAGYSAADHPPVIVDVAAQTGQRCEQHTKQQPRPRYCPVGR